MLACDLCGQDYFFPQTSTSEGVELQSLPTSNMYSESTPRSWWRRCRSWCLVGKRKCCKVDDVDKLMKIARPECWQDCRIIFKTARASSEFLLQVNIKLLTAQCSVNSSPTEQGSFLSIYPWPTFPSKRHFKTERHFNWVLFGLKMSLLSSLGQCVFSVKSGPVLKTNLLDCFDFFR